MTQEIYGDLIIILLLLLDCETDKKAVLWA